MMPSEAAAAMRLLPFPAREAAIAAGRGTVLDLRPLLVRRARAAARATPPSPGATA